MKPIINYYKGRDERDRKVLYVIILDPFTGDHLNSYHFLTAELFRSKDVFKFIADCTPEYATIPYDQIETKELYAN